MTAFKQSMMICLNSPFSYIPSRRTAVTLSSFVSFKKKKVEFLIKCLVINQESYTGLGGMYG